MAIAQARTLRAFIASRRRLAFSWAEGCDCCLLGADWLMFAGFSDPAPDLRAYRTRLGALRAVKKAGFARVAELVAARLCPARRPRLGALVLIPDPPLDGLMIAESAHAAWAQGEAGLERLPIPPCASFWEPR